MLEEADLARLHKAFPDLLLTPARANIIVTETVIAMSLGVAGLMAAIAALIWHRR